MVKLATAREIRTYGPRFGRDRAEYINAGLYVFATAVLMGGLAAAGFSWVPSSGLVLILIALALVAVVNIHDLLAHLAGFDYRLRLMEYDLQLALVEFAVPLVQTAGSVVFFLGILFIFYQVDKEYGNREVEKHAINLLIAGPLLWVIGSIHNSCQIYERADGHVQILQQSIHIPFLIGSVLFLVAAILNSHKQARLPHHGQELLGKTWVWLGISGGLFFFMGGLMNVLKVFNFQQVAGLRLEKLRGSAQDRLLQEREGHLPLVAKGERLKRMEVEEARERPRRRWENEEAMIGEARERTGKRETEETKNAGSASYAEIGAAPSQTPWKDAVVGKS